MTEDVPPLSVASPRLFWTSRNGDANASPGWNAPSNGMTLTRWVRGRPVHRTPPIPAIPEIVWLSWLSDRCASSTTEPGVQLMVTGTVALPSAATVPSPAVAVTAPYAG